MQTIDEFRKARNADICRDFRDNCRRGYSLVSKVFAQLAIQYGMTAQGIEKIVRQAGLYNGKPGRKKVKRTIIN